MTLVYRWNPPPASPVVVNRNFYNTIKETAVYFRNTVEQRHIYHQFNSANYLRQDAFLVLLPGGHTNAEADDAARPTKAAQRLLKIFSRESAKKELQPFYSSIVRDVLKDEQERYQSKPSQAISLIWNLFGRRQAFRTLTRFYMSAVEKLGSNYYPALSSPNALFLAAGVLLHSNVYRRYVRQIWRNESSELPLRYISKEQRIADDLANMQVVKRIMPPREMLEREAGEQPETFHNIPEPSVQPVRLNDADFRALVQGVAQSLGREARLESMRRGRL